MFLRSACRAVSRMHCMILDFRRQSWSRRHLSSSSLKACATGLLMKTVPPLRVVMTDFSADCALGPPEPFDKRSG